MERNPEAAAADVATGLPLWILPPWTNLAARDGRGYEVADKAVGAEACHYGRRYGEEAVAADEAMGRPLRSPLL